jgi:hypothetical protein
LRRTIRTLLTLTIGVSLMGSVVPGSPTAHLPSASAATTSKLTLAIRHERSITHRITSIRHAIDRRNQRMRRRLPDRPVAPAVSGATTTGFLTQWAQHLRAVKRWQHRTHAMKRRVGHLALQKRKRVQELARKRSALRAWIAQWGILETCPVRGLREVMDNFGVMVRIPGVPAHIHQGNDILSPYGTPIVAPFAGRAVASSNELGGLAVKVYGSRGYVYNAHLERFGRLGSVQAGTVIGYVGATGDAGGPHDHFEWHPGNGAAVDPNPYLSVVC